MEKSNFYAVLYQTTTHIPGDERSISNPGHGYPAHTVTNNEYRIFENIDEFKEWIKAEESKIYSKRAYQAVQCTPIQVTSTVTVDIEYNK
jgi:hypothetical protein